MDETDVLVPDDLDLVDKTETAQVVPQHLLGGVLVQTSQIHVPARVALADRQGDLARHGRGFAPTDLELLAVQGQLLDGCVCVERSGGSAIQEGEEDAGLLGEDSDGLERAEVDKAEELVDGSGGRQVSYVNGTSSGVGRVEAVEAVERASIEVRLLAEVEVQRRNARLVEALLHDGKISVWRTIEVDAKRKPSKDSRQGFQDKRSA